MSQLTKSLAAGLLVAALAGAGSAAAAEKVSVRLSFTPFAAHIPIYVAKEKGYYAKAGLDVDILVGRGSSFAAMTVGSGKEEFGIADPASVVTTKAQGVPVVVVANLQQDNGVALFATEASGITKVEDMKGRNTGVYTGSTTTIFLEALLKKHGLTMDDIKPVTVRSGTDLPLILDGKIDAEVSVYNNELISWRIEHPELKLRTWHMSELGFDTPGYAIVTNETLVKEHPDQVRGFVAATVQGMQDAVADPAAAVAILTKAVPELSAKVEREKWQATIPASRGKDGAFGTIDRAKWQTVDNLLTTYAVIKQKVDLDTLIDPQFQPKKP